MPPEEPSGEEIRSKDGSAWKPAPAAQSTKSARVEGEFFGLPTGEIRAKGECWEQQAITKGEEFRMSYPHADEPEIDPAVLPLDLSHPLMWIKTDGLGEAAYDRKVETGSRINRIEAQAIQAT